MQRTDLISRHCVPCEGGVDPLTNQQEEMYLSAVPSWGVERDGVHRIKKQILVKNFLDAVELIRKVAVIAEEQGHHPDIRLFQYKHVEFSLFTHAIDGLSENDFILAAKIDELLADHHVSTSL